MSEASGALHPPFASAIRQRQSMTFGMWIFLVSELLLFGALFLAYFVDRHLHAAAFAAAGRETDLAFGAANTAVLLTSSLSLSVASRAAARGRTGLAEAGIWITLALGLTFILLKGLEYREDLGKHLWPGPDFALADPAARLFFGLYWIMTGLHGCHITIGVALLARLGLIARRRRLLLDSDSVEATTLYWHLVDVVWTLLFPCLYLVGRG